MLRSTNGERFIHQKFIPEIDRKNDPPWMVLTGHKKLPRFDPQNCLMYLIVETDLRQGAIANATTLLDVTTSSWTDY